MSTARAALVTGGASGLGAATAKRLRADGLSVYRASKAAVIGLTKSAGKELASDRVSFSTGAVYDISGGRATS